ncbi:MAG: hypothetical protein KF880_02115 [Ferruginibacter sp.]|nr:hypothetical protein [Ferruginibacter sp.]
MAFTFDSTQTEPLGIYQCPSCDFIVLNETFLIDDGDPFEVFSDGKRVSENSEDYPIITRCEKCGEIFWMRDDTVIVEIPWSKDIDEKYYHVKAAKPLNLQELIQCVQRKYFDTEDEEMYLRTRLLWRFNDRLRVQLPLYYTKLERDMWYNNLYRFKEILKFEDYNDRILLAEAERNLSNYKNAIDLLDSLPYVDMIWLRDKYILQCRLRNPEVFRIM